MTETNIALTQALGAFLAALRETETALAKEFNALFEINNDRDLTPEEARRSDELAAALGRVRTQMTLVAAAQLDALDRSETVQAMVAQFRAIVAALAQDKARLDGVVTIVTTIGTAAAAGERFVQLVATAAAGTAGTAARGPAGGIG